MKKSYRLSALAIAAFAMACAADNPDVAAKAANQELSVTRLADLLGHAGAVPMEKDVARSIAILWVNYQLLGEAAAKNDSLKDPKLLDYALWSNIDNIRVRKFYDSVSKGWDTISHGSDEQRYMSGELLAARHILVQVDQNATPEQREAARKKAEAIRAEATPQNFAKLAAKSDEPGAAQSGGDLGLFQKGQMVPEFEKAVLAIKPGEISPVVQTSFGYHVIYRSPFADVAAKFEPEAKKRNVAIAESTYLSKVEDAAGIKVASGAGIKAKAIARNPLGSRDDKTQLASYKGGELTASEFADWIAAYPVTSQIVPQLLAAPDSAVEKFVRTIVRNELILRQADSAKAQLDSAERANLYMMFAANLSQTWTQLGLDPKMLTDSAKTGSKEAYAAKKIENYFDKLVRNEAQFVDISYPVTRALQKKYDFSINEKSLDAVIAKAKLVRAAADSGRAQTAPVPGGPPVGGDTARKGTTVTPPPAGKQPGK